MPSSFHAPLARLLDPVVQCLTPGVARQIIALQPDPETQARIDQLAGKAAAGTLSPNERVEYQGYVEAIDVVSILQAKARKMLT
ncbi:MAG TPA: hypothetical protein VFC78_05725 [Tepidisphaeraceae bacterium]|nr:hypothetical protein [Tepidisphaeraceae bacterium]